MGIRAELDARPGGVFRVDPNGRDIIRGTYLEVLPPSRVVFTWDWEEKGHRVPAGSTRVEIELKRSGTGKEWDGTRIVFGLKEDQGKTTVCFAQADWKAETDYFVSCNTTWGELMFRLKAAAEGKAPGPLFSMDAMAY